MSNRLRGVLLLLTCVVLAPPVGSESTGLVMATVHATVETEPVASSGDAADDPAIWIHPSEPRLSLIIGTNKQGALDVYDLGGKRLQTIPNMQPNNVDVRQRLGSKHDIDLVAFSDRKDNSIGLFRVDGKSRTLSSVRSGDGKCGFEVYGSCMYVRTDTGESGVFVNSKTGEVEQYRCNFGDDGTIALEKIRRFKVGGQLEGCVFDDEAGVLYIGEEGHGIWRYDMNTQNPGAESTRRLVDRASPSGRLVPDVEGLTIYLGPNGSGYLIASSQGNNSYAVYRREGTNEYIGSFRILEGNRLGGTEDTDGIAVCAADLGKGFEAGVFVAQDGMNDPAAQNFKLVPWATVAEAVLRKDGSDPRE
jgi:3-phytase